ncbi:hypothetical protein [Bifidobacterium sp. SO1]|uniref:hypothetical protein n=1 Tax=Bifidobacterium sp. SO1 TaxID=2809029 RepID=UPI001BDCE174|nr:hypothetical protein [Bifidobacterium sp. SO1]MBT1161825.1 hypothetical protein [Bifidobacterium sp. SO1]
MRTAKPFLILLLMEGPTDKRTLDPALKYWFAAHTGNRIGYAEPFHCDVTTLRLFPMNGDRARLAPPFDDACSTVDRFVARHVKDSSFTPGEYRCVAQLIDLDGAFAPDDIIVEQKGWMKPSMARIGFAPEIRMH